jgi:hypothetical protein
MRWDELKVEAEEGRTLPGYRDPAVVRTFDAPEALDTRFYEVRAKSALNRVPERSRMPFRWTINPYRGCSHACSYCVAGDTQVHMADGRTKAMVDLRIGDEIYGTLREGSYRRYVVTHVLDRWSTWRAAYRVTLEDGTELVASSDHRFLTARGWKHVTGKEQGRRRRPHLTTNDKLIGTGGFSAAPPESDEYRQGYLCGIIRGDGTLGSYAYDRPGRTAYAIHGFRLALTDLEALKRSRSFLATLDIRTRQFAYRRATGSSSAMGAIRTGALSSADRIRELIAWPRQPGDDWCKGFLAGIFDAEGSHSGTIRIANTDPEILDWTTWCLRRFNFMSTL